MKVEIIGKFYDNHSLSIVNRNIALRLSQKDMLGNDLAISPLDAPNEKFNLDTQTILSLRDLASKTIDPDIQIRHTYPPIWNHPKNKKTRIIYIQPWEFSKAPFEWQYKFETFADALIVPSSYIAGVFRAGGLDPDKLYTIPNGYDDTIFNTNSTKTSPYVKQGYKNYVFVGNYQWRKGLDILLTAWHKTFNAADKVNLIIKDNPSVYGDSSLLNDIVYLQYKTKCASISYIEDSLSSEDMACIYKSSDFIVQPHRAEGFGMPIQEAMACGCVPIVPNSGPTEDFVKSKNSYKINTTTKGIDMTNSTVFAIKPGDALTLMGSHSIIQEPDVFSLIDCLKASYNDKSSKRVTGTINTWDKVANQYYRAIGEVYDKP